MGFSCVDVTLVAAVVPELMIALWNYGWLLIIRLDMMMLLIRVIFVTIVFELISFHVFGDVLIGDVFNLQRLSGLLGWLLFHLSNLFNSEIGRRAELLNAVLSLVENDHVDFESAQSRQLHALLDEILRSLAFGIPQFYNVGNLFWVVWHSVCGRL